MSFGGLAVKYTEILAWTTESVTCGIVESITNVTKMGVSIGWYLLTKFWVYIVCPDSWFRSSAIPMNAMGFLSVPLLDILVARGQVLEQVTGKLKPIQFIWCSWGWLCFLSVLCYCMLEWLGKSSELYRVRRLADWKGWTWNLSYTSYQGPQFWNAFRFFGLLTLVHKWSTPWWH